jgi:hypothetical protein
MSRSCTQTPSLAQRELFDLRWDSVFDRTVERHGPERYMPRLPGRLPGLIRTIHRAAQPSTPEHTR